VLAQQKSEFMRDAAIKRFEMVFDLAWKVLKASLELQGLRCASPLGCLREAFRLGLAEAVYARLPTLLQHFQALAAALDPRS
jgi:hypothetical protein